MFMDQVSSTSLNLFLEETNTFDNSSPESETFCIDLEENIVAVPLPDFPDCEDSRACSIHMSFTSSASVWESSIQI
ncbi:hypothetical protein Tco_0044729 [Tanacetum coccineum]